MKKIILVLAIAGICTQANAQKVKTSSVPVPVTTAFNKDHQTVKLVDWSLTDGNNYEASFKEGKVDTYVKYEASGNLLETKRAISGSELPAPVMSYVKQNYKEDEVKNAFKITEADGTITYKGTVKDMTLLFDSEGTFIKSIKK